MIVVALSITILLSSATGTAAGLTEGVFSYELIKDGTEVEITGYSGAGEDVVIPSTIAGKSVTSIRYGAFGGMPWLASVTIPEGVTSIGNYAFQGCSSLASIDMPDSVATIGIGTFQNCVSLTSLVVPANVVSINGSSFSGCTSLAMIALPDGLRYIGNSAFYDCASLTSVIVPNGVAKVDASAFRGCEGLVSVTLPDSITVLGSSVFYGCTNLTSAIIPNGVAYISNQLFYGCTNLTSAIIPNGVAYIGSEAFRGCTNLTSMVIPDSVIMINGSAFRECRNLISVTLPDDLTTLGSSVFLRCANLTSMVIPANVGTIGGQAFADCGSLTRVEFMGDAPTVGENWTRNHNPDLTIYHLSSAKGFDAEAWASLNLIPLSAPGAPQDVRAVGHKVSAVLNWEAPLTEGDSAITGYEVLYNEGDGWSRYGDILSADDRSITLTGLEAGKTYEFGVKAINAIGPSIMSDVASAVPFTTPAAPQITAAVGDGSVTLSWNELVAPENGWADIDHYVIYVDGVEVDRTVEASFTVAELNNGQEYSFVVVAHNAAGNSTQSNSALAIPFTVPNAPTGLTAAAGDGRVTLNWTAPAVDGGSPISAYEIWFGTSDNSSKWIKHKENLAADRLNATVSGLEAGTKYYFGIKAKNAAGASELSSVLSAETWPALVPISGKVVDAEGNGLAGITVTLDNATSATTDADGKFVIMAYRGEHTLTISGEGIESLTKSVAVAGLGLDIETIEASKAAVAPSGDMGAVIIAVVAIAAVLAGVLGFLRQRRK